MEWEIHQNSGWTHFFDSCPLICISFHYPGANKHGDMENTLDMQSFPRGNHGNFAFRYWFDRKWKPRINLDVPIAGTKPTTWGPQKEPKSFTRMWKRWHGPHTFQGSNMFQLFNLFLGGCYMFYPLGWCSGISQPCLITQLVRSHYIPFVSHYPLVNVYITMERSTIFNGKIHYFYGNFQ